MQKSTIVQLSQPAGKQAMRINAENGIIETR